jgi:hypothetical protein
VNSISAEAKRTWEEFRTGYILLQIFKEVADFGLLLYIKRKLAPLCHTYTAAFPPNTIPSPRVLQLIHTQSPDNDNFLSLTNLVSTS